MQAGLGLTKNGQGPQAGLLGLATATTDFTAAPGPVQEVDLGARSTSHSRLQGPSPPLSNLHLRGQFHVFYCLGSPSSLFPSLCLLCPCSSCRGVSPKWIFRKLPGSLGTARFFFLLFLGQSLTARICGFQRNCQSRILLIRLKSQRAT